MNTRSLRPATPIGNVGQAPVLVRELAATDREPMLTHFLALDDDDRRLRFGQFVPDHVLGNYVGTIDFGRDAVFGVFDPALELVGVGHLAYLPDEDGKHTAEFGVSVRASARGRGIGSTLFERAVIRSRNTHVSTLYMHCLSRNATMMHIARKSGMRIERACGEADAYLSLPPADPSTILAEALQEQAAVFDYVMKRQTRRATQIFASLLPAGIAA